MILIAPDKFKSTFTAPEVAKLIDASVNKYLPRLTTQRLPLADGGEGTCELLAEYFNAEAVKINVLDPLLRSIATEYYFSESSKTALIETAKASGLYLLSENEKNPLKTSSFGSGQIIANALEKGAKTIIVTLGGSAVNDAGTGLAHALGFRFYDTNKQNIFPSGENIGNISEADNSELKYSFSDIKIIVLSDVENPLYGENGASKVFAKQKGANKQEIELLENSIIRFSEVLENYKPGVSRQKGAGAAGGMAAGLSAFCGAQIQSGSDFVLKTINFEGYLKKAKFLITGEGKLDQQSFEGKLVGSLLQKAKKFNCQTAVICGMSEFNDKDSNTNIAVYTLFDRNPSNAKAIAETPERIEKAVKRLTKDFELD